MVYLLLMFWAALGAAASDRVVPFDQRVEAAAAAVLAPVVSLRVEKVRARASVGTGILVDGDARLVLTNHHLVAASESLRVTLVDGTELGARVVHTDPRRDLALLKLSGRGDLPTVSRFASERPRLGQMVLTAGNPGGYSHSVTMGIVSALDREVDRAGVFLQIDAPAYNGSSGGPVVDLDGAVLGLVSRGGAGGSVAFAIPAADLITFLGVYEAMTQPGAVESGYLGAELQPLTEGLRVALGAPIAQGAVVAHVFEGGAGDRAGLREGDVLVRVGSTATQPRDEAEMADILDQITATGPTRVTAEVFRDGERAQLDLVLASRPACRADAIGQGPTRMEAFAEGSCYLVPQDGFVRVSSIWRHRDVYARTDLPLAGDLIVSVDGHGKRLSSRVEAALQAASGVVIAKVLREGSPRLTVIPSNS